MSSQVAKLEADAKAAELETRVAFLEQGLETKKDNIAAAVTERANSEAAKHEKRVEPLEQETNTEEGKTPEAEAKRAISKMATVFDPQRRVS
jgi:hypothetical protein